MTICKECGEPTTAPKRGSVKFFCSPACRMTFNNRRMQRGSDAYDLLCALRRERGTAKELGIWSELCRLELSWHEEDRKERNGRKSYVPPSDALRNLRDKGALPRGVLLAK